MVDKGIEVRLAMRDEGEFVVCYLAHQGSMTGSVVLGSFRKAILEQHPDVWEKWKLLMAETLNLMIKFITGLEVENWTEQSAPESEKIGHA
jgi:hypothetical protein